MKAGKRKLVAALMVATAMAFPIGVVHATTENIDATATFLAAITLTGSNLVFSKVIYSAAPTVAGDFVRVGTNGAATYGGVFSAGPGAATAAGDVTLTAGTDGETIEVRCDTTATMTDGAGASIDVTGIEAAAENATAAYGGASACNGTGGAAATTLVLNLGTLDGFKFGGQVDGSTAAAWAGGSFSTANAGGDDIQVDVVYQ